ncbi:MAG: aminoglycoside phosphotransferase family protein [Ruminococcaceae bacterium]|nr:aminoglycoside phosphotransferase family protein [Oscillospiraceae bacterium]
MTTENKNARYINDALRAFFGKKPTYCIPYGNGHINDTFLVVLQKRYILQRMNTSIFTKPYELMENILGITSHMLSKAAMSGKDVSRCTLIVIPAIDGNSVFRDEGGNYWRVFEFVESTVAREKVEHTSDFEACGEAFGQFQQLLSDYPADKLHVTIENFHNTPWRFENLLTAEKKNTAGRAEEVAPELEFAKARAEFCKTLENAYANGTLPLRVTHNDTKLNNILFDATTGQPVCVVDLDTVMPGYSVNDFGDSIRFGANTATEDETDLSKVSLDLELFEAYAKGFLRGCNGSLTKTELALLPIGAIMMTLECGMRFLTDYLDGDVYFKIHRDKHNLDRARCQFALVADMERKLPEMNAIIERLN